MDNVIPLHKTGKGKYKIEVLEAGSSNLMPQTVQALRENKAVILKLETLDKKQAQRLLDFICGSAYAISGYPVKVGEAVFLFVPYSIQAEFRLSS